jgi:hypothetical protein
VLTGTRPESPPPNAGKQRAIRSPSTTAFGWTLAGLLLFGLGLRLERYVLCYPLYGDEASLAANLLERGYAGLLRPLDYGQVAPLLFLWIERAVVDGLGFHEWALRLTPFLASVLSLILFARLARRVLGESLACLAGVAVFAVSTTLLRYSAEIKPYSADLLVATLLLGWACSAVESRGERGPILALALFCPIAPLLSFPSLFVIAGALVALELQAWSCRDRQGQLLVALVGVSVAAVAAVYYVEFLAPHYAFHRRFMTNYWQESFPPRTGPIAFVTWLVQIHTGRLMAYPVGDKNGASLVSFALFAAGCWSWWRQGRGWLVLVLILPFAATLSAAILHRYPYGGNGRIVQHLVPAICLGIGQGIEILGRAMAQRWPSFDPARWVLGSLTALGLYFATANFLRPYSEEVDPATRAICRDFWCRHGDRSRLIVLTHFDGERSSGMLHREAIWRCYQRIYAPQSLAGSPAETPVEVDTLILHLSHHDSIDRESIDRAMSWARGLPGSEGREKLSWPGRRQLHDERVIVVTRKNGQVTR